VPLQTRLPRRPGSERERGSAGASTPPHVARILELQSSVGNAAVADMLGGQQDGGQGGAPASPVADLARRAGSAAGLRQVLAAEPALATQVISFFASGGEDAALNALLAEAFAPAQEGQETDTVPGQAPTADKGPKSATVKLPDPISHEKTLDKGVMKWTLQADSHSSARCDVDFKPDETKVEAKTVSFGQTVVNTIGDKNFYAGATPDDPQANKDIYQPFEEAKTKRRMDHLAPSENDPFYGAEWDQNNKKWKKESDPKWDIGFSKKDDESKSATMYDIPGTALGREGMGDAEKEFETVPLVLETRQPLGSLRWGFRIKDSENAPLELMGGKPEDCTDSPSDAWSDTMDRYYEAKYEEILDEFDVAKADLKKDHLEKLDRIVVKMKANEGLKAQLGGAADLTGNADFNMALSKKRADNARDYLVKQGIDAARLDVQSYGADWARVEEEAGTAEGKNRRVQIWLH
jgi:flagellar motor protein MotB